MYTKIKTSSYFKYPTVNTNKIKLKVKFIKTDLIAKTNNATIKLINSGENGCQRNSSSGKILSSSNSINNSLLWSTSVVWAGVDNVVVATVVVVGGVVVVEVVVVVVVVVVEVEVVVVYGSIMG